MQLPGAEFGAFTWGYTVDPPLAGLSDRPLVTRDLLPLGSVAAMDLLYALDDRFQIGAAEPEAVAPIARLFGVDAIWLAGDAAFDRFRTPRPELTAQLFAAGTEGLGAPQPYGAAAVNVPRVPMVDEQSLSVAAVGAAVPPVEIVPVLDPVPVVRASDRVVVLAGSGDGIVDAAAAGLLDGDEAIFYSAALAEADLVAMLDDADALVVTDSNRRRAHHWRSSQDVTGYTEPGRGPATVWEDSGDARLEVFPDSAPGTQTIAVLDGPLAVSASSYGERFAYLPESRPARAVDGDPNTAWTVLDPAGQFLDVTTIEGIDHVTLLQAGGLADVRRLGSVELSVNGAEPVGVQLDERSLIAGQRIAVPATDGPTTVRIALGDVLPAGGFHRGHDHPDRTPVGIAEVDVGVGSSPEWIAVPSDLTAAMRGADIARPVTYVLTRERVRATNRQRSDPEWRIARLIDVPFDQPADVTATVRLDLRAPDAVLAALLGIDGPTATARLAGVPAAGGWAAADGDVDTAWMTPFDQVVGGALEAEVLDPAQPLSLQQRTGNYSLVTALRLTQGGSTFDALVPPPDGDGVSTVALPAGIAAGPLRIEISSVTERTTRDRRFGDTVVMPVAITEIGNIAGSSLPAGFDTGCRDDLVAIDAEPVALRVSGSLTAALAGEALETAPCSGPVTLAAGQREITGQQGRRSGLQVDRLVLAGSGETTAGAATGPLATVVDSARLGRTISVERCPEGCWLIVGEGYHPSWTAATAAGSLGPPQLVSGGFNGWRIPPREGATTVWVGWTAQRPLNVAIAVSIGAAAIAALLVVAERHRANPPPPPLAAARWASWRSDGVRRSLVAAGAWVVLAAVFVEPTWAWWGLLGGAALVIARRIRLAALVGAGILVYVAVDVAVTVHRDQPAPTPAFPLQFEDLHHLGLFAAVAVAVSAFARRRA
jgi:arabinofuranan 3-O-arabinosyltransferase